MLICGSFSLCNSCSSLCFFDKQASLRDLFSSSSANDFGSVQENVASDDGEKSMSLSTKQVEEVRPSIIILQMFDCKLYLVATAS